MEQYLPSSYLWTYGYFCGNRPYSSPSYLKCSICCWDCYQFVIIYCPLLFIFQVIYLERHWSIIFCMFWEIWLRIRLRLAWIWNLNVSFLVWYFVRFLWFQNFNYQQRFFSRSSKNQRKMLDYKAHARQFQ